MNFSEAMFYENYLTSDSHTNTVISDVFAYLSKITVVSEGEQGEGGGGGGGSSLENLKQPRKKKLNRKCRWS